MASARQVRRQIRSVRSTRQITRAMELISATKLRKAGAATVAARPYTERITAVLADLRADGSEPHPLFEVREVKVTAVFVLSADRGLAGGYNAGIARAAERFARQEDAAGRSVLFITAGARAERALRRSGRAIEQSYPAFTGTPSAPEADPVAAGLAALFRDGRADAAVILTTRYVSALRQEVAAVPLLPLRLPERRGEEPLLEPGRELLVAALLPRLLSAQVYQAILEAAASEQAARRMAMHAAADNAGELIDGLTLTANGLRQAAITQELAEISGGAAAL